MAHLISNITYQKTIKSIYLKNKTLPNYNKLNKSL